MELRFIERSVPAPQYGKNIGMIVKVLQYRERALLGNLFTGWQDVPLVKQEGSY